VNDHDIKQADSVSSASDYFRTLHFRKEQLNGKLTLYFYLEWTQFINKIAHMFRLELNNGKPSMKFVMIGGKVTTKVSSPLLFIMYD